MSTIAAERTTARSVHRRHWLRRDLRVSLIDGAAFGGMVGFGETYLPAFALAIGLGELSAGLVASLPLAAGGIMQMISPQVVRWLGSHKRWVVLCAALQALTFMPLMWAAWSGTVSLPWLLMIASVYWASGLSAGPAWNTWIGTVVPRAIRSRFFAFRTRASQMLVFGGVVLGGITLKWAAAEEIVLTAFLALFALACCCRLVSAFFLAQQSEPVPMPADMRLVPWRELLAELREGNGGRLLVYLVAVQAAAQTSGPYFTPFMLKKLEFDYGQFVALIAVAFLSKILALSAWGQFAHMHGARKLLWIGAIGITPLSASWVISRQFEWLLLLQALGGVTWAAYELAFFLMFFDSIPERDRTSLLTLYNLLNTLAWVGGSLLGGSVLYLLDATYGAYLCVFVMSGVGRCLALILLARLPKREVVTTEVALRTLAVRPAMGSVDTPVLPSMEKNLTECAVAAESVVMEELLPGVSTVSRAQVAAAQVLIEPASVGRRAGSLEPVEVRPAETSAVHAVVEVVPPRAERDGERVVPNPFVPANLTEEKLRKQLEFSNVA